MTHLLPGGRVPRVHGAASTVRPRLPHFVTSQSVCYLANRSQVLTHYVARLMHGRPGCCRWRVSATSLSPVGPPGTALADAVPCWCVCGARGRLGGWGRCRFSLPPSIAVPPPRPSWCLWRVALSRCPLSLPADTPFHVVCVLLQLGPLALFVRDVCSLCVCVITRPRCSPVPPSPCILARALREVPSQDGGRLVPGGSCLSTFPAQFPCFACCWWEGGGQPGPRASLLLSLWCGGVSGAGHSPSPNLPSLGRAAGAHCPVFLGRGGYGRGGPSATPQRTLFQLALRAVGGAERRPGGCASCLREGCPESGTLPPQKACPWGVQPGPAAPFPWARGVQARWTFINATAHTLAGWHCALSRRQEGT